MLNQALSSSRSLNQIDLDVNRTFRNTIYFRDRYGPRQCALFRVLAAYSVYNADVGYCQEGTNQRHIDKELTIFMRIIVMWHN
ncbi:unnamed protein product [Trichobilharzia regenti]|nr:unnamed protein product [Trichobilharzia regenti]